MATTQNALRRVLGFRNAPPSAILSIYRSSLQQRAFGATSAVKRATGPVPKFGPTTNPELDATLAKLREDDIIPAFLPQNYYRLVYRSKNHDRLIRDPITIQLDDEPYTLTPKLKQPSSPGKLFAKALDLMNEPADFAVLPELLRGYSITSSIAPVVLARVARRVTKFGDADVLMEIARTANHSGFHFNKGIARNFMFMLRRLGQQPHRASVVKAVDYAKELLTIIGKRELYIDPESTTRYSNDPIVLGTVLSIYADAALRSHEVWHEDVAEELLLQLKNVWEDIEWNPTFKEYNEKYLRTQLKLDYHRSADDVKALTVVLEGMLQAKKVFGGPGQESSSLLEAEGEEKVLGEPGPESLSLGAGGEGLEAEGGEWAGSGGLPPKKPKRVRPADPALLSWLETESVRLATLITRLQEYVDKTWPLVSQKLVGKADGKAEAEHEARDRGGEGDEAEQEGNETRDRGGEGDEAEQENETRDRGGEGEEEKKL